MVRLPVDWTPCWYAGSGSYRLRPPPEPMKVPSGARVIAPARLAVVRVVGVEREARAADRHHVGRKGGVFGIGGSVVARAGHEGHARDVEDAVIGRLVGGEDALALGEAPAHRHHRHARLAGGGGHAGHQVGQRLAVGLDEDDLGPGAMAWAHSTSRASSTSQLSVPGPLGSVAGSDVAWPFWLSTVRNDDAGPYCW